MRILKTATILAAVWLGLCTASHAESRSIAVEVFRDGQKQTRVNIHSEVKEENKKAVSVADAAGILQSAKGWGSSVQVVIVVDRVDLRTYLPLLQAVADNLWLDPVGIKADYDGAEAILRHYKIGRRPKRPASPGSSLPSTGK